MNVLLVGPILTLMLVGSPLGIPMLYDRSFMVILRMTQLALLSMFWKAVYIPIEYLPLSKGQSWVFLCQEATCVFLLVSCEISGFRYMGLNGLGVGVLAAYFLETLCVVAFARLYYSFRLAKKTMRSMIEQGLFLSGTVLLIVLDMDALLYWLFGIAYSFLHFAFAFYQLKAKTNVICVLTEKFRKKGRN